MHMNASWELLIFFPNLMIVGTCPSSQHVQMHYEIMLLEPQGCQMNILIKLWCKLGSLGVLRITDILNLL
jgi:hypothetical protein